MAEVKRSESAVLEFIIFAYGIAEGVKTGIPGNVNVFCNALALQIRTAFNRWSKMTVSDAGGKRSVHFLGEGRIFIVGAKSRFNVAYRNLFVKRSKCCGK